MTSDDESECPTPRRPGPLARRVNEWLGGAWAGAWLALLLGTVRLAHAVSGRLRQGTDPSAPRSLARAAHADRSEEVAVPARARRAYT